MKKFASILIAATVLVAVSSAAHAEAEKTAKSVSFSFEGPFGTFDKAQLQRGYKVYKEVCSNCHSMKLVAFRNLADKGGPGFSEEQVKALAKSFKIHDFNDAGEGIDRQGLASDYFPSPFATPAAAAAAVPAAQDSFTASARALSSRAGAASLCRAARTRGVGGEYPSLVEYLDAG